MWTESLEVLNPYEALNKHLEGKNKSKRICHKHLYDKIGQFCGGKVMNCMRFVCGANMLDFYLIPTIKIEKHCEMKYLTVEWLKWYIGIQWEV